MQAAIIFIALASSPVAASTPGSLNLTPIAATIQSVLRLAQAASQTSSGRMQALAAASTALNVYNNAKDIGDAATALGKSDLSLHDGGI